MTTNLARVRRLIAIALSVGVMAGSAGAAGQTAGTPTQADLEQALQDTGLGAQVQLSNIVRTNGVDYRTQGAGMYEVRYSAMLVPADMVSLMLVSQTERGNFGRAAIEAEKQGELISRVVPGHVPQAPGAPRRYVHGSKGDKIPVLGYVRFLSTESGWERARIEVRVAPSALAK